MRGLSFGLAALWFAAAGDGSPLHRFDFGSADHVAEGWTAVDAEMAFDPSRGYGFEAGSRVEVNDRGGADTLRRDFVTTDQSALFSIRVPREGNYRVTVTLGDAAGESVTTVRAELRRLMVEEAATRRNGFLVRRFIVNTRTPSIDATRAVRLKERERTYEARAWDDRVTIEITGARPALCALEIEAADDVPTLYLLGDSTMTDQARAPYGGWGQIIPRFLEDGVAVANHGESGESYASAFSEGRVDKVLSLLRPGDFVALQFGHNDQKALDATTGAFGDYAAAIRRCVTLLREKKAVPILVTSMHRHAFDASGRVVNTLGDYPVAVRRVAVELGVALIDLHAMSAPLYEAYGPTEAHALFVPGDTTHPNLFGAYQLARCVVDGLRHARLPIARHIGPGFQPFDPACPEPASAFAVPNHSLPEAPAARAP